MVNTNDVRKVNTERRKMKNAVDELISLAKVGEREGVDLDEAAYEDAQQEVKEAVVNLIDIADDIVDRTDELELPSGTTIQLPGPALERVQSKDLPESANVSNGSGSKE